MQIRILTSLKSLKNGVGSISQKYGSRDPDPHQNVTDKTLIKTLIKRINDKAVRQHEKPKVFVLKLKILMVQQEKTSNLNKRCDKKNYLLVSSLRTRKSSVYNFSPFFTKKLLS